MPKIKLDGYECCRCHYRWFPRPRRGKENKVPGVCPNCKTYLWNEPKVEKKDE